MSRNPALAHLQTASLYTLVRGKHEYPYATVSQLARLLERDWLAAGGVLSEQERGEVAQALENAGNRLSCAKEGQL